jgi:hypothetical protein
MEYDEDKVDEMVLALLLLTTFEESPYGARAWKGHDWNVLDRLHAKGYISDPKSKAKSVVVTEECVKQSRALFAKYFGKNSLTVSRRAVGFESMIEDLATCLPSLIHSD